MKHIKKQREPREFTDWKELANEEWTPTYDVLSDPPKAVLHKALLSEQGYICCYCMRRISKDDSHIEHFRPQTHYPELALDFGNLLASCPRNTKKEPPPPLHCGPAKGGEPAPGTEDEKLLLSPLDPQCESFFRYVAGSGEIRPSEAPDKLDRASKTISILRLDEPRLQAQRERAFAAILDYVKDLDLSKDEDRAVIETEIGRHKEQNAHRQFEPFCAGIVHLLEWWRGN